MGGVRKREKGHGFVKPPSQCKIQFRWLLLRICYPLDFYYRFSCSIRLSLLLLFKALNGMVLAYIRDLINVRKHSRYSL